MTCNLGNFTQSSELINWLDRHPVQLRKKIASLVIKQIIKSPSLLLDFWSEVMKAMEDTEAPQKVRAEAEEIAIELEGILKEERFVPKGEQTALIELVDAFQAGDPEGIVQQAILQRKLSTDTGERIIRYMQEQRSIRFNGDACAFCAALAAEFGPGASLVACVVCGLLA